MDGPVWLSVGSILTSGAVAIAAVWLTARFAGKQAHLGRIWDRKAEAYSAILEALHDMEEWYSLELDDEIVRREVDDATAEARRGEYRAARKLLRRSIAREVWLLPDAVHKRVAKMNSVLEARYESYLDDIDAGYSEVRKTITEIATLAQIDMESRAKPGRGDRH